MSLCTGDGQLPQLRFIRSEVAAHFLQRRDQARAGTGVVEAHKLAFFKGDVHIKAPFPRSFWALFCVDVLGPVGF